MCFCSSKQQNSNPLARQYKLSKNKFTKNEFLLLNKIFKDVSSRSSGDTMAKEDFIRFFPLSGLWGDRMFERFDLLGTGTINQEEFIIGLGNSAKLSQEEQIKYLFNVYDLTNNNCITKSELLMMLYNYPQEDLQEITQDPYFTEIMQKKEHQQKQAEEPSFNATSQFFQSQIQGFMQSRQSNPNFQSKRSNSQSESDSQSQYTQSKSVIPAIKQNKDDDIGQEDPVLSNLMINDRNITNEASKSYKLNNDLKQFINKTQNQKPTGHIHLSKNQNSNKQQNQNNEKPVVKKQQKARPTKKNNNIPIKPSNITNIIKQYCDFVFREFNIEKLSYEHFKTWCLEHYTVFNIFKNTFYFGFWGEENNQMQYKFKKLDMEGYLIQIKKDKSLKKLYYELRENFLLYFNDIGQKPKGIICLDGLIVNVNDANEFNDDEALKKKMQGLAGFEITHKDTFYKGRKLYCSLEQRHQWMKHLEDYSKTNFHDQYILNEKIGVGRFSAVYRGFKKNVKNTDGKQLEYAVKIMKKNELTNEEIQFISYETETMRFLKHPGIINVESTIEDKNHVYIITEIVKGGDLFQYIHQNEFLEEVEASVLMKQLFATIVYIHDAGIIHRDLKPENIMVVKSTEKDKNGKYPVKQIKIIDFGFSKMLQIGQLCEGYCGSQNYLAPEIIRNEMYGMKVDNFALGCIMFFMLRGSLPYDSWDPEEINQNTLEGKYSLDDDHWNNVSPQAKDLIEGLLKTNPEDRISTRDALQHEWITNRKLLEQYKGKNPHGMWENKEDPSITNQSNQ